MKPVILEARALSIGYRRRHKADMVLAGGLNLCLRPGELIGLLGPNGIGKSTLLRTLARLHKPLAGQVLLGGADAAMLSLAALARRLSLVLTAAPQPNLMNGYALVALGRHPHTDWLGRLTDEDHSAIERALAAVDAANLAERRVAQLSDGQRQKLMIARALAQESEIMLLDEPTAYLDLPRRVETMRLMRQLAHDSGRAILVSTHDLELALRNCDRLWLMSETGIEQGAPEDLALAGSLGATFRADGIRFDQRTGAFVSEPPVRRAVSLCGDGLPAIWMRRALERRGYGIVDAPGAVQIRRQPNGHQQIWQLQIGDRRSRHRSIQDLLDALERQSS